MRPEKAVFLNRHICSYVHAAAKVCHTTCTACLAPLASPIMHGSCGIMLAFKRTILTGIRQNSLSGVSTVA